MTVSVENLDISDRGVMTTAERRTSPIYRIPAFGLYGDAAEPSAVRYAHIETIAERAPMYDWKDQLASAHRSCPVHSGKRRGRRTRDRGKQAICGTVVRWLPAGFVHGFEFVPGTVGWC